MFVWLAVNASVTQIIQSKCIADAFGWRICRSSYSAPSYNLFKIHIGYSITTPIGMFIFHTVNLVILFKVLPYHFP